MLIKGTKCVQVIGHLDSLPGYSSGTMLTGRWSQWSAAVNGLDCTGNGEADMVIGM